MNDNDRGQFSLSEHLTPSDRIVHSIERILVHEQTAFQDLKIIKSRTFGKALLLDSTWQSCTLDEFIYHESLVHPAMLAQSSPRSVLILGGGEGATAREALRWRSVTKVVMVDIDGEVVEACRNHLPEMHGGAFEDPRFELVVGDALELLETTDERWDVVISDLSDPIEHGPSFRLFTQEYFQRAKRVIAPGGCIAVQAGSISPVEVDVHARLHRTLASCFRHAATYSAFVPSFGTPWSFVLASDEPLDRAPEPTRIDGILHDQVQGSLSMLNGATLRGAFALAPYIVEALERATHPYTLADPPKFGRGIGAT